jgi:hypothetical protein
MREELSFIKRPVVWHVLCALFLLVVALFLMARAHDEYRWSDWGFGDAQTMLSLNQWHKEGWIKNRFLFIPQGYFQSIDLLDSPPLRHHAHGICPTTTPRIGPRLWYTHYPAGYLIPYAVLFELGLQDIFFMRLLSIVFSVFAVALFYVMVGYLVSPAIAFFSVMFYCSSGVFLGFADSLANHPLDDLLRFAFMCAVVFSTRLSSGEKRRIAAITAWLVGLCLAFTSLDSIFFIFVWLVGWDIIEGQGSRWKRYLVFFLAPLFAYALQFLQNIWYLGFPDAVVDITDTVFIKGGGVAAHHSRLVIATYFFLKLFADLYRPVFLIPLILLFFCLATKISRGKDQQERVFIVKILCLLLLCAGVYAYLFPNAVKMYYQGRQILPFVALLVGAFTVFSFAALRRAGGQGKESTGKRVFNKAFAYCSFVLCGTFWIFQAVDIPVPRYGHLKEDLDVALVKEMKALPVPHEPVIFTVEGFNRLYDPAYVPGYPQIDPLLEYYFGSRPIFCFTKTEDLITDLLYLSQHSPTSFSPVIITKSRERMDAVVSALSEEGIFVSQSREPSLIKKRYVLVLPEIRGETAGFSKTSLK